MELILNRSEALTELRAYMDEPGWVRAMGVLAESLGLVSPGVALIKSVTDSRIQSDINRAFLAWVEVANLELLKRRVIDELRSPTRARMFMLLGQVLPIDFYAEVCDGNPLAVVLNQQTVVEFEPYIGEGWLILTSTGAIASMGAGNRVGNHVEEVKRAYGFGAGFVLQVTGKGVGA